MSRDLYSFVLHVLFGKQGLEIAYLLGARQGTGGTQTSDRSVRYNPRMRESLKQ